MLALAGVLAAALSRPRGFARRASQSARLGALFLAPLLPSLAIYPSISAWMSASKERRVEAEYAPQAAQQREQLQATLPRALRPSSGAVVGRVRHLVGRVRRAHRQTVRFWSGPKPISRPRCPRWSARSEWRPASWFALNLPEYGTTPFRGGSCDAWAPPYEETSPFGSSRRNVLRASRAICDGRRGRRRCRARDARLPIAALHLVEQSVSRVVARGPEPGV